MRTDAERHDDCELWMVLARASWRPGVPAKGLTVEPEGEIVVGSRNDPHASGGRYVKVADRERSIQRVVVVVAEKLTAEVDAQRVS